MNDLISRNIAIKAIVDLPNCYNGFSDTFDKACIIGVLEELVSIDAVQVVRCKDCKWFVHDDDCYGDCSNEGGAKDFVYTNDFCSRAERKEE